MISRPVYKIYSWAYCSVVKLNRVDEYDVRVVDFPQHLLNARLRTSSPVHQIVRHTLALL